MRRSNVFSRHAARVAAFSLVLPIACADALGQSGSLELRGPRGENATLAASPSPGTSREFYGVGTLFRVKRNDTGAVRYALMDDNSQIVAFLAPSSRIDLKEYIGKEIGVTARKFGEQDDVAPHVIVDEVTPMFLRRDSSVSQAQHQESLQPIMVTPMDTGQRGPELLPYGGDGVYYADAEPMYNQGVTGGYFGEDCNSCSTAPYCGTGSCTSCGVGSPCNCQPFCGPPGCLWLRGEYLLWWADGVDLPPLVTTSPSGTSAQNAGVLGENATILYGNEAALTEGRSGFRIRFGGFFGPLRRFAWEGEYFNPGSIDETVQFSGDGTGLPILARPFFNMNPRIGGVGGLDPPPRWDSQLISYPGQLTGTVGINTFSRFHGAAGRFRFNCCCLSGDSFGGCNSCSAYGPCHRCGYPPYRRIDFTAGYRYYGLSEGIRISEDLTSLQSNNPGRFQLMDEFKTRNDFHGGEIGTNFEWGWNRWTLETLMRVAIGGTRQQVTIDGQTTISPLVSTAQTYQGGLLAQRSNIGTYTQNEFSMIPEFATTLGFYLSPRMRFTVGYTLIYWSGVARPGDQIDLDVNPDLIPPEMVPFVGPLRPEFDFRTGDFWAQGLNLGLDYRW